MLVIRLNQMYSENCVMNPPLLRLLFKAKGFNDVGGFISQTGELKVR